ncbi:hypothetical protein ACFL7E_07105 [Thermodesulfobacteriota bacterium]
MHTHQTAPIMNQKIFDLGLSVETVSAYLLCCSLFDNDTVLSTNNLLGIWNSTEAALHEGLDDLLKRNILRRIISESEGNNVYTLTDVTDWDVS